MMRSLTVLLACLAAVPAAAQGISQPTPPPIVTAENDAWYRQRQPVPFSGDTYYPAGATELPVDVAVLNAIRITRKN